MNKTTPNTVPNKESVRRICLLSGGTYCYLLVKNDKPYIELVSDLKDNAIKPCEVELESWCGMVFKVFSPKTKKIDHSRISIIKSQGEKIWPIEEA